MATTPSAQEIKTAANKKGCDAIPFADLREAGKRAYQKQLTECKGFAVAGIATATAQELDAASHRAQLCREARIAVRTVFARAIGRVKEVLAKMKSGDPLKPDLAKILKELESSQKGHEVAIDDVNKAFLKYEERLKKLGT